MDISSNPAATEPNANNNTSSSGRDEKGRFQKGNRGGPGNPFTRQAAKLRQAALNAVSEEDIASIIEKSARAGGSVPPRIVAAFARDRPTLQALRSKGLRRKA